MQKTPITRNSFTIIKTTLLVGLASAFVLMPGCNCGDDEPAQAKLTITEPADKAEITSSQDEDPFTDGIQIFSKSEGGKRKLKDKRLPR